MERHYRFLHFLKNRELNEFYLSMAIRSFSYSLISVFIPVYLLKLGYSLQEVLFFYFIFSLTHLVFTIPAAKVSSKYGFKHSILFSIPFLLLFYLMLYTLDIYGWPLFIPAIIFGLKNAFFWMGYHTHLSKFSDKKHRGEEISIVRISTSLFHVAGPFIGGLIVSFFGFKILFLVVIFFLFSSAIPLFFSQDSYDSTKFSLKKLFSIKRSRDIISFIGYGMEIAVGVVIWPVFIFTAILNNYTTLGLVTTLSWFFSMIFAFVIGKSSDVKRSFVLRIGAVCNAVVWIVRAFVRTSLQVFIIDSFYGITKISKDISFDAICYDKANKRSILEYIIFREIFIQIGKSLMFLLMMIFTSYVFGFLSASLGSLLHLFF
ncbi:MFS transporter [Candidatus Pacearchaeota archaeon]|nr:MFS transporter [Candidatus Pacearchaeota archaeon]MBD3282907.1 MFS transporter [Candidatus Pacearchaeota archaeon]